MSDSAAKVRELLAMASQCGTPHSTTENVILNFCVSGSSDTSQFLDRMRRAGTGESIVQGLAADAAFIGRMAKMRDGTLARKSEILERAKASASASLEPAASSPAPTLPATPVSAAAQVEHETRVTPAVASSETARTHDPAVAVELQRPVAASAEELFADQAVDRYLSRELQRPPAANAEERFADQMVDQYLRERNS